MSSQPLNGTATGRVQRPVPLREAVYEALLDLIITRELHPGRHLVESELAVQLGVSRQPVREALQRLSNEGWVDLRPGYGAFVHQPTESEADQLLAVRALLETESARLAARNAAPEEIDLLWRLWREGVTAVDDDDVDAVVTANANFHRSVTEVSGNRVLAELAAQVDRRVRWYYAPIARSRGRASWDEHASMIEAIVARDETEAARLMREHTERTRRTYHEQIDGVSAG
ncbi:DNA-binding GntR family transcriptional regulator [Spinactinospora alkalitolerans]|uniref:DNA-binding GntR family transcriptional regulator n=1 Tax=Spinactinospora alkalitolerans TaxID=687207 RepID=A0A852TTG6_9ACTN|nr:GntR family transcriptional regulator [Spinactinospora alkalitolerans]NYE47309.1 DNA-binding GntR family transcriptional regulator [Spinactinospora alkalitolerans]